MSAAGSGNLCGSRALGNPAIQVVRAAGFWVGHLGVGQLYWFNANREPRGTAARRLVERDGATHQGDEASHGAFDTRPGHPFKFAVF